VSALKVESFLWQASEGRGRKMLLLAQEKKKHLLYSELPLGATWQGTVSTFYLLRTMLG
jgi:hypothetical protein